MSTRERMMLLGPGQVSEVELLALIIGGDKALARALDLIQATGGLLGLERTSPRALSRIPGVGSEGAAAIGAARELGRRMGRLSLRYGRSLTTPDDVADYLRAAIGSAAEERFMVLGLDVKQRPVIVRTVAVGSLTSVQVHPREVFRPVVEAGAHAVILVHNHPSGDASPSDQDIILTHRMMRVGAALGIEVVDHLVVTREKVASLADLGHIARHTDAGFRWGQSP